MMNLSYPCLKFLLKKHVSLRYLAGLNNSWWIPWDDNNAPQFTKIEARVTFPNIYFGLSAKVFIELIAIYSLVGLTHFA